MMKHPTITVIPCFQFMRPVSIMKPMKATAITATLVAIGPRRPDRIPSTAATIGPEPRGVGVLGA
jgi:hypothetical protein